MSQHLKPLRPLWGCFGLLVWHAVGLVPVPIYWLGGGNFERGVGLGVLSCFVLLFYLAGFNIGPDLAAKVQHEWDRQESNDP